MADVDHHRGPGPYDIDYFDYGYYDPETKTIWHANHAAGSDPGDPMLIFQSTPLAFITDRISTGFDRCVFSLVYRQ